MPMSCLFVLPLVLVGAAGQSATQINPVPRARLAEVEIARWDFDKTTDGWTAEHQCTLAAEGGLLKIKTQGHDPYFHRPVDLPGGELVLQMRVRCRAEGGGQVFWTTDRAPGRSPAQSQSFSLKHDGTWQECEAVFSAPGRLRDLRLDPGTGTGEVEIDWIRLARRPLHPLEIEAVSADGPQARFVVRNHADEPIEFSAFGKSYKAPAQASVTVEQPTDAAKPMEAITIEVAAKGRDLPPVRRTIFVVHPEAKGDWLSRPLGDFTLEVARDGSTARVRRGEVVAAVLAPTVHCEGKVPALRLTQETPSLCFEGDGARLSISTAGKEVSISIVAAKPCEGPVVRALGAFQGGVLAGVEYLGRGDASSSPLDANPPKHLRYAPDPLHMTLPLASLVSDRAAVAMTWTDMALQPLYATPNFFDGTSDHRMALRGTKIEATLLVDRLPVEETIAWAVAKHGLPPLPKPPRTVEAQWALCLKALGGPPLKTEAGWGHCAEDHWPRHPFADMGSTICRLTGNIPELTRLVPGGSHVTNESIYFVTGRAAEWKARHEQQVRGLIAQQRPDGSYRYNGPFAKGHFEDTANGVCARPAALLLEYARLTGDPKALEAGLRTLDYMKRFDVPRGAQVWEIPLHTPDQLASAYGVWAYVRGFELSGKKEYLAEARRWALSGIPFVYLWGRYPIMLYATPPVFGATNWEAPMWIGLPVQWVGGVYAYALTMLAPHDKSVDWNHLARGILISAEQQQYPDGPWAGLLPDSVTLATQTRNPWRINPCALVSLRLVLDGQVDYLAVATEGKHRVAAPFPVTIRDGHAVIRGQAGLKYQVLVDGRIVDVVSLGEDRVELP
jgi:hypothetical protein